MIKVYFDKEHLLSFIYSLQEDEKWFLRCNDMLRSHIEVNINMTEEELADNEILVQWLNLQMEECEKDEVVQYVKQSKFPYNKIYSSYADFVSKSKRVDHSSIFLCNNIQIEGMGKNYLVGEKSESLEVLKRLQFADPDDKYKKSLAPIKKYFGESWDILSRYSLPCSDIILCDAYILSFPDRVRENLASLLRTMSPNEDFAQLNIIIITIGKYESVKLDDEGSVIKWVGKIIKEEIRYNNDDYNRFRNMIKGEYSSSLRERVNITFITTSSKKFYTEHDRTIFTNYMYYKPGITLNFYDSDGKFVSRGRHFDFQCIAHHDNHDEADCFIDDMQEFCNKLKINKRLGFINRDRNFMNISNYIKV